MRSAKQIVLALVAVAWVLVFATPVIAQLEEGTPSPPAEWGGQQTTIPGIGEPGGGAPSAPHTSPPVGGYVLLAVVIGIGLLAIWPTWMAGAPSPLHQATRRLALSTMSLGLLAPLLAALFQVDSEFGPVAAVLVVCAGGATLSYLDPRRQAGRVVPIICVAAALLFSIFIAVGGVYYFADVRSRHQSAFMIMNIAVPFVIATMLLAMIVAVVRINRDKQGFVSRRA